jgi:O-methyltransferase domain
MANQRLFHFWAHLIEALRTGAPQSEVKTGQSFFAEVYADPAHLRRFLQGMTGVSHGANLAVAKKFPWSNYKRFADLGGAQGDLSLQIALANPHLTGVGFDLPVVGPVFEEYVEKDPLPEAEVYLMGHILHDWDLEEKKRLIRKVYDALPAGGAFIVYEAIIDDDRSKNAFGLLMSLNMLIETPGGFDYSGADCIGWMREAGFREAMVEHLVGPDSMVVGVK